MANILTLLADSVEGEGDDSLVCHLLFKFTQIVSIHYILNY